MEVARSGFELLLLRFVIPVNPTPPSIYAFHPPPPSPHPPIPPSPLPFVLPFD